MEEADRWVSDPLAVVEEIIGRGGSVRDALEEQIISSEACRRSVPLLNASSVLSVPHHSLVRYRCMVQDQFDPEFYFQVYHIRSSASSSSSCQGEAVSIQQHGQGEAVACSGWYRDLNHHPVDCEIDFDHPRNKTADRQTLYCVPIPGETPWVKDLYGKEMGVTSGCGLTTDASGRGTKRPVPDDECSEESAVDSKRVRDDGQPKPDMKGEGRGREAKEDHDFNFPLPWEGGVPCLVKVYENFDEFKVCSCLEVYGVLSRDPALADVGGGEGEASGGDIITMETASERRAHCPPPSLTPRIHAITVQHLTHNNPLLPWKLSIPSDRKELSFDVQATRKLLIRLLSDALLGDQLGAEFVLLHLLSAVHGRTELLALGKFALNLSNCSSQIVSNLQYLFQLLLTKSVYLPMSLENMNKWRFSPKKDYNANRLSSGLLQLTDGSHILVDETALSAGQLNQDGLKNLTALGNVIQWQKLNYDFLFHTTEFHTDLQVLIASEGKSILQVDCHVPVVPVSPSSDDIISPALSEGDLSRLRCYLSLQRLHPYSLNQQVQKGLEEDFVGLRQSDPSMTGAVFQYLLTLSRLLSLSYGQEQLTLDLWTQAKHMEQLRRERQQ